MADGGAAGRPAAQYLRRSMGLAGLAIEAQEAVIADYASRHGFDLVARFEDLRSGLTFARRPGLQALLAEALGPRPRFQAILVHDVSRWGRFQDIDESAHYEFLCRRAGLAVEYCAEAFANDGSPSSNLQKQAKRSMAAEFSRDISRRVVSGQRAAAARGFHIGRVPFGYRRVVVDEEGAELAQIEPGVTRPGRGLRTRLRLGPPAEVETVRRIFRDYVVAGLSPKVIAANLVAEGAPSGEADEWSAKRVERLLRHPAYGGDLVFGRSAQRLGGPVTRPPEDRWVRVADAIPPMVAKAMVEAAQTCRGTPRRALRKTDAEMLQDLRDLLACKGRLDTGLIDAAPGICQACTYIERFGGLRRAYALIGYRTAVAAGPPRPQILGQQSHRRAAGRAPLQAAAAYLRVSRTSQAAALPQQADQLEAYARDHGLDLVRTYVDAGRSGLTLTKRPALRQVLADVLSGAPGYSVLLVQDVSRWGRFQDPDEAAHLEYLCRASGVSVRYCAEPFEAAGAAGDAQKGLKRLYAAEFSAELSRKTRAAQASIVRRGFKAGGPVGYGLRRRLVSADGERGAVLAPGETKGRDSDRVVVELGPEAEVAVVREIFERYGRAQHTMAEIARDLNRRGVVGPGGTAWTVQNIGDLLARPLYVGIETYGRRRGLLGAPRLRAREGDWVVFEGMLPPAVPPALFAAAQARRRARGGRGAAAGAPATQTARAAISHILPGYIDPAPVDRAGEHEYRTLPHPMRDPHYTAFAGDRQLAAGSLQAITPKVKAAADAGAARLIVFDDAEGRVVDLDLRGSIADVLSRLPAPAAAPEPPVARGRGRPKLGVAPREVTLLPRHWDWLATQPGGASAALRRLVEQAMRDNAGPDTRRAAQEVAYRTMTTLAGHLPGYEEALRALYAPARERFEALVADWPTDIAAYVRRQAADAFM